jgi:hypothetical protein
VSRNKTMMLIKIDRMIFILRPKQPLRDGYKETQ